MKFDNFEIHARPFISEASCSKCHTDLTEVSNGWFSAAMFCPKCESVFVIKLIKVPDSKVGRDFIEQCRKEIASKKGKQ